MTAVGDRSSERAVWVDRRMANRGIGMATATVVYIGAHSLLALPPHWAFLGFAPAVWFVLFGNPWWLEQRFEDTHELPWRREPARVAWWHVDSTPGSYDQTRADQEADDEVRTWASPTNCG